MPRSTYLIALGSNRRHGRYGAPRAVIEAALTALRGCDGLTILAASQTIETAPLGPAQRRYANAVALIETRMTPPALLLHLKQKERDFGRRPGRRWGPRVIDLDLILWSGGIWASSTLVIPHLQFRTRHFVLKPACALVPDWRDPVSGLRIRHLAHRAVDRSAKRP